jgi:hypothetical protein
VAQAEAGRRAGVAGDTEVDPVVGAEGARVGVDLDDDGVRADQRPVLGGPAGQGAAPGDDQVGGADQLGRHGAREGGGDRRDQVRGGAQPGPDPDRGQRDVGPGLGLDLDREAEQHGAALVPGLDESRPVRLQRADDLGAARAADAEYGADARVTGEGGTDPMRDCSWLRGSDEQGAGRASTH